MPPRSSQLDGQPFGTLTKPIKVLLHAAALYSSYYAFSSLDKIEQLTGIHASKQYGGQWQLLTINGLTLTTIIFALAVARDLLPSLPIAGLHRTLLLTALPFESLITLLYWGIHLYDSSPLIPLREVHDASNPDQILRVEAVKVPLLLDATLHALPGVFLLLEYLAFTADGGRAAGRKVKAASCALAGWGYIEYCASINGHYVYPLIDLLSLPRRLALYTGCTTTVLANLIVLEKVYDLIHPAQPSIGGRKKTT